MSVVTPAVLQPRSQPAAPHGAYIGLRVRTGSPGGGELGEQEDWRLGSAWLNSREAADDGEAALAANMRSSERPAWAPSVAISACGALVHRQVCVLGADGGKC
jgi:hypothetical protein